MSPPARMGAAAEAALTTRVMEAGVGIRDPRDVTLTATRRGRSQAAPLKPDGKVLRVGVPW